jgi:hypothetical protein
VRIEWHLIHSVTVGQIEIKLFNNPDSATPTETKTGTANHNNAASTTTMKFGSIGGASTGTYWLDNIVAGAASYPGPASVTALPLSYGRFTGPAQLTASPVTLYTCPTSRVARTLHIHASNPSSSAVDVTISVGADAAGTRIYGGFSVPADSVIRRYDEYSLAAGETIQAWASSAATVVLTVTGYDKAV